MSNLNFLNPILTARCSRLLTDSANHSSNKWKSDLWSLTLPKSISLRSIWPLPTSCSIQHVRKWTRPQYIPSHRPNVQVHKKQALSVLRGDRVWRTINVIWIPANCKLNWRRVYRSGVAITPNASYKYTLTYKQSNMTAAFLPRSWPQIAAAVAMP